MTAFTQLRRSFTLVPAVIALSACGTDAPSALGPQKVEAVPVESALMESQLSLPGQLDPQQQVDLYARVPGFIEQVLVDRGSAVSAGQVLVRLSAPELQAARGSSEAEVRSAQARLAAAEAKYAADSLTAQRMANAARTPGVLADNDVQVARQAAAASAAQVAAARSAVAQARGASVGSAQMADYLTIRAPFGGTITERNLHPGALVGPSAGARPILRMVSGGDLRLTVNVPQDAAGAVQLGQPVSFSLSGAPGQPFTAPLVRRAAAADPRTRTVAAELRVPAGTSAALAGSFATVKWPMRRAQPTLQVPSTAVTNDQQRTFVIRVSSGKTEWVDVSTGMTKDGKVEVFGKLAKGDKVVLRGTDALKEGTAVSPVAPKPAPPSK
jgi:RND family efflux transporter MFP subunit